MYQSFRKLKEPMKIKNIRGRQILDSRGNPTVECVLTLDNGNYVTASVPSGASVGKYEAMELRDNDKACYMGKGVLTAINHINTTIVRAIIGREPDVITLDKELLSLDGTSNKSKLGVNAILPVSIAILRAQAHCQRVELFELINTLWGFEKPSMPVCMFNVINGGMHAQSGLAFQEFMVMPRLSGFSQNLETAVVLYHELKVLLAHKGYATSLGDEGGFAPRFTSQGLEKERAALQSLVGVIHKAGARNVSICLDVAASAFYDEQKQKYIFHDTAYTGVDLIDLYQDLSKDFPILSIEDGLAEDDWNGWQSLTSRMGEIVQLVGDDIFVTNIQRIQQGIDQGVANAVLIKPNQIGSVTETIKAIQLCKNAGYKIVISHRSGETNDSFIADLAVGTAAGQLKTGAPARGERVAKYNRLLEIEEILK
jgi:enolase